MRFQPAAVSEIDEITAIVDEAKKYLLRHGVWQWQEGYPNRETILADIASGIGYVLLDGETVAGYVAVSHEDEPYLHTLAGGSWKEEKFCAIWHRICVAPQYRSSGASDELLDNVENLCREAGDTNIRVDTHRLNAPMHLLLERHGYTSCGELTLLTGGKDPKRIGFQLLL